MKLNLNKLPAQFLKLWQYLKAAIYGYGTHALNICKTYSNRLLEFANLSGTTGQRTNESAQTKKALKRTYLHGIFARRRRSLVGEILQLYMFLGVLIYIVFVGGLWWASSSVIEDNLRKWAIQWVNELDELGAPLYNSDDSERFVRVEEFVSKFPEITYVRYYAKDGKLLYAENSNGAVAASDKTGLPRRYLSLLSDVTSSKKPFLLEDNENDYTQIRAFTAVWLESMTAAGLFDLDPTSDQNDKIDLVGFVELGINFSAYRNQLVRNIIVGSSVFAIIFIFVLIVGRKLFIRALRPLSDLQVPLAELARGETNIHVAKSRHREIKVITRALNRTIHALNQRNEMLTKLANYDSLTGLVNRHYFLSFLENAVADRTDSALLFVDLDQFKYVNDTLGHASGDRLIAQAACCLKNALRKHDVISRFGGDEFTILLHDITKRSAVKVTGSLLHAMQDLTFYEDGHAFNIQCSIGITMIDSDQYRPEELLSHADMACHEAKRNGRNRWHLYEPSNQEKEQMTIDVGWSQRIQKAIKDGSSDKFMGSQHASWG